MSGCSASGLRSPIRFGRAAAVAAAGLVLGSAALGARQTRIECDLTGARHEHYGSTFTIDHEKGALRWIEGDEELRIERHSPTELRASRHGRFGGATSANAAFFDLSLFSGAATMTYLHEPTPAEVAQCERQQPSGCRDPVELPQYAESGSCTVTDSGGD